MTSEHIHHENAGVAKMTCSKTNDLSKVVGAAGEGGGTPKESTLTSNYTAVESKELCFAENNSTIGHE